MRKAILLTIFTLACIASTATNFRIGIIGDPQVRHEKDLDLARRSVYSELISRKDCDLMIILGDLVNECPRLIQPSCDILDSLNCPWVRVQGNHDGPYHLPDSTFSMNGIRFILMDDTIQPGGGFTDSQIAWLDSVVTASPEKNFILAAHKPYSTSKSREMTDPILKRCPNLLILVAHTHSAKRHQLWPGVQEIIASTTCGSWWRGTKDRKGIPESMQKDGAPRGYFIADIDQDFNYTLQYKCVGRSAKDVASAYFDGETLFVNVYGGHIDGKVEAEINGKCVELQCDGKAQAPEAELVVRMNEGLSSSKVARNIAYIPIKRTGSPHVWTIKPGEEISGKIRIRYSDPYMEFSRNLKIRTLEEK